MNTQIDNFLCNMNKLNSTINLRQLKKEQIDDDALQLKKVEVIRTLPFEYIESLLPPFLQMWGVKAHFSYSDYDTALSQMTLGNESELQIIWMDWRLYVDKMKPNETVEWIVSRIQSSGTKTPILINNWPTFLEQEELLFSSSIGKRKWFRKLNNLLEEASEIISLLEIIDLDYIASKKGLTIYDLRNDTISSYPFSNTFTLDIARYLSLNLLPAIFQPRLKAIVLDLDNTLYSGVLGEDGYDGIQLEEEHIQLQKVLRSLKESGILLSISSKNDHNDVVDLFNKRKDFILKLEDFTFIEANWKDKASNIASIIQRINIDPSAVLFIDDNLAEITQVKNHLQNLHVLLADASGKETVHRLLNYPGLYSFKKDDAASLRQSDILANQKRNELLEKSGNEFEYLKSLKMKIDIYENNLDHAQRVAELSNKTNQFNLALKRYSLDDIQQFLNNGKMKIYTVELSDVLSNSGIIGIFICELNDEHLSIKETLFSCRALGRHVESMAFLEILKRLQTFGAKSISFDTVVGPKNRPALDWVASLELDENNDIIEVRNLLKEKLSQISMEVINHYE